MIQILRFGTTTVAVGPVDRGLPRREAERAAVAGLLARLAPGATLVHTADGAPALPGSGLNVSISHSATMAAVAVDPCRRVGVDIEGHDRAGQIARVAPRVLSPVELHGYAGRLVEAWTLKEALYKIAGDPGIDWRHALPIPPSPPAALVCSTDIAGCRLTVVAAQ